MSYDENELVSFKMDDDEDEPMEPLEEGDDFKFEEEPEEDPEDRFH